MSRLSAFATVASLFLVPGAVDSQVIGVTQGQLAGSAEEYFEWAQNPRAHAFQTLCTDANRLYCFSAYHWSYTAQPGGHVYGLAGQWFGAGFSNGFENYTNYFRFGLQLEEPCGFQRDVWGGYNDISWGHDPQVPLGFVGIGNPSGEFGCPLVEAPTLDHFTVLSVGSAPEMSCSPYDNTCYQVPEPSSLWLLFSGLAGMAWVARRKVLSERL